MLRREFRQKVGGRLPDALAQAAGRRLELPGLHLRGDRPGLGEGGFAGLHGEYRLQGRGRPIPVVGRHLREHVAHEVHHAPLVLRPGKHRVHRGDESRAPVSDHQAHALQTAFDHASYELLPAGSVLPHALRHADDLAVALRVDADGDEDADVLHASAPGALVPHAVHEHVRVFGFQWPGAPSVDVVIHALELVGKGLGWHPVTPQQFADVVDLTGAHSRQVHLHQRLLDAGLPPAVAFDDRGFEDRALEFRHPELEPARLCRERAFVVAGPVRLAPLLAFVSGGPGDLVGLGVEHGVEDLGHLLGDQPVEFGLEQVLVDLYDVAVGHGCASCFPIAILCLATENRTQDAGHARFNISTKNKTESAQEFGRYLVHFMRNVLSKTPPSHREWASAALKPIFARENRESAMAKAGTVAGEMEERKLKAAANCLREGVGETTTYLLPEFPANHRIKLRTNNMIERLNKEIRRRTRVVGSFPDSNSALMLVCARIRYVTSRSWLDRRYMDMSRLDDNLGAAA